MDRTARLVRGATELAAGQLAEAENTYRDLLAETPLDAEVLSNLGAVYNVAQCHAAAEAACRAALAALPGYWAALANLGTALHRQQRFEEAITVYLQAVRANPGNASGWTNLGVALTEQGRPVQALPMHNAAVALAPEDPEVRTNRALALLSAGDLLGGFAEFDWRWRTPSMAPHRLEGPRWLGRALGAENIAGRTLLLHEEGGFGDTLQFVRFVPQAAALGARIILRAQPELLGLLRRSFPGVSVISNQAPAAPHDLHTPLLSLPRCFRTTLETIPARTPYLTPCPDAAALWQARLQRELGAKNLRVGLVWSGAARLGMAQMRAMDHRRSLPPENLAPLSGLPRVQFVSLQFRHPDPPSTPPQTLNIFDPMADITDFDDTAALIENLDLVIAVDTAVAHLAGALGKPVWLLSRFDTCWRWIAGRTDSPWYPGMRIFRQPKPGDWASVIRDVRAALAKTAKERMFFFEKKNQKTFMS